MTEERMALIERVEKQADGNLLREILACGAEPIVEAEVEARCPKVPLRRHPSRSRHVVAMTRERVLSWCIIESI